MHYVRNAKVYVKVFKMNMMIMNDQHNDIIITLYIIILKSFLSVVCDSHGSSCEKFACLSCSLHL